MAKQEDIQKAGKPTAGGQEPEKPANQTTKIETVEDLETLYPVLVSEIRDEVVDKIGKCPAQEVKKNLPELYQRIVMEIQGKSGPDMSVPGFLLEVDDPVAAGTLRFYQKLKRVGDLRLPYVLPYKDKVTKQALENYILRAEGSGDTKRANAAREAMKKVM
ncbi:MAG: hypothetical protein ACETVZ_00170 [Phycisphaerae bacterium]